MELETTHVRVYPEYDAAGAPGYRAKRKPALDAAETVELGNPLPIVPMLQYESKKRVKPAHASANPTHHGGNPADYDPAPQHSLCLVSWCRGKESHTHVTGTGKAAAAGVANVAAVPYSMRAISFRPPAGGGPAAPQTSRMHFVKDQQYNLRDFANGHGRHRGTDFSDMARSQIKRARMIATPAGALYTTVMPPVFNKPLMRRGWTTRRPSPDEFRRIRQVALDVPKLPAYLDADGLQAQLTTEPLYLAAVRACCATDLRDYTLGPGTVDAAALTTVATALSAWIARQGARHTLLGPGRRGFWRTTSNYAAAANKRNLRRDMDGRSRPRIERDRMSRPGNDWFPTLAEM